MVTDRRFGRPVRRMGRTANVTAKRREGRRSKGSGAVLQCFPGIVGNARHAVNTAGRGVELDHHPVVVVNPVTIRLETRRDANDDRLLHGTHWMWRWASVILQIPMPFVPQASRRHRLPAVGGLS